MGTPSSSTRPKYAWKGGQRFPYRISLTELPTPAVSAVRGIFHEISDIIRAPPPETKRKHCSITAEWSIEIKELSHSGQTQGIQSRRESVNQFYSPILSDDLRNSRSPSTQNPFPLAWLTATLICRARYTQHEQTRQIFSNIFEYFDYLPLSSVRSFLADILSLKHKEIQMVLHW